MSKCLISKQQGEEHKRDKKNLKDKSEVCNHMVCCYLDDSRMRNVAGRECMQDTLIPHACFVWTQTVVLGGFYEMITKIYRQLI